MSQRFFFKLSSFALLVMLCGCGGKGKNGPSKSIKAEGTVTLNGKPFGPGVLSFVHATERDAPGIEAKVKEDGTFSVMTFKSGEKEPQGKYNVVLAEDPEVMSVKGIPPVRPLTVDIQMPGEGQALTLAIKFKKKKGRMTTGGPDPNAGTRSSTSPGGI